jgi:myo-inositol 2-dehydrogenase / D-chiro-inositol 1-dehydrogenase
MALRVGVIGTGVMGAEHVRTLATAVSGVDIAAVFDADPERVAALAREVGCQAHDEPFELIRDDTVDAVVIAAPDDTHEKFVLACLDAGKPVLCEKPLTPTADGCRRVVEAEVATGRRLVQVGFMRRYDPGYLAMKRVVDSGLIGQPLLVHCAHRNVDSTPEFGSSMLITSSAVHEFDVTRWLLGEEIVAATAHLPKRSRLVPSGVQDPQLVVLRTTSGALVDVEVFVNARYGYDVRCEIVGETGTVSLPPPETVTTRHAGTDGRPVPADFRIRFGAAYRAELHAWAAAAAAGRVTGPSGWDGYAAMAVAEACVESTRTEATVPVRLAHRPPLYPAP